MDIVRQPIHQKDSVPSDHAYSILSLIGSCVHFTVAMIPRRLTLKHFLSYHQASLDFSEIQCACICGENSVGKSALFEALVWVVWGRCQISHDDDLVHRGATTATVELVVELLGHEYRITRTREYQQSTHVQFQAWDAVTATYADLTTNCLEQTQGQINRHLDWDYDSFRRMFYVTQAGDCTDTQLLELLVQSLGCQTQSIGNLVQGTENFFPARSVLEHQLAWQTDHLQKLEAEHIHHAQQLAWVEHQLQQLDPLLQAAPRIEAGYAYYQTLQTQATKLGEQAIAFHHLNQQRQTLERQLNQAYFRVQQDLLACELQWTQINTQRQKLLELIGQAPDIQAALGQLHQAQEVLQSLDLLQHLAFPLLHRQQKLEQEQSQYTAHLEARLAALQANAAQLQAQRAQAPHLQKAVVEISSQLAYLTKQRIYLRHLQETGQARRRFMEQLQARQRELETQLGQLQTCQHPLSLPNPQCPVCERPLLQRHLQVVQQHYQQEQEALLDQIWVIREQLAVSEREIQVLRREYREVVQQLQQRDQVLTQRGRLEAQLSSTAGLGQHLQGILVEINRLQHQLHQDAPAPHQAWEWEDLQLQLADLNYDEKNHALARGEVERWQWAVARAEELHQAEQDLEILDRQLWHLQAQRTHLHRSLHAFLTDSPLAKALAAVVSQLEELPYSPSTHASLQSQLRRYQPYQDQWHALNQAWLHLPHLQSHLQTLESHLDLLRARIDQNHQDIADLEIQLQSVALAPPSTPAWPIPLDTDFAELAHTINPLLQTLCSRPLQVEFIRQPPAHSTPLNTSGYKIWITDVAETYPLETCRAQERSLIHLAIHLGWVQFLAKRWGQPIPLLWIDQPTPEITPEIEQRIWTTLQMIATEVRCQLFVTQFAADWATLSTQILIHETTQGSQIKVFCPLQPLLQANVSQSPSSEEPQKSLTKPRSRRKPRPNTLK